MAKRKFRHSEPRIVNYDGPPATRVADPRFQIYADPSGLLTSRLIQPAAPAQPATSARKKPKPYKPRSEDAKAIVEQLERGKWSDAQIIRRLQVKPEMFRVTKKRWLDSRKSRYGSENSNSRR